MRKIRVAPYLCEDTHRKLKKLAIACDTNKTDLAARIVKMAVNHPDVVEQLQAAFNVDKDYRVYPVIDANDKKSIHY